MDMNETMVLLQLTQGAKIVSCTYLNESGSNHRLDNPFKQPVCSDKYDDTKSGVGRRDEAFWDSNGEAHWKKQHYHFKNVLGLQLGKGDVVVVDSRDSMALVVVEEPDVAHYEVGCNLGDLKHVVAKVDRTAYHKMKELEYKAKHRLSMSELDERLRKFTENTTGLDSVKGMFALSDDSVVDSPNLNEEAT